MKIGLAQISMAWEDRQATKAGILSLIERDGVQGCDWLVFPEMTLSGYSMDSAKTTLDATDFDFFSDLARRHGLAITFGGVVGNKNHSFTMDKDGMPVSRYAKLHLCSFASEEKFYDPGEPPQLFRLGGHGVLPGICYDLRFPYNFWEHAPEVVFMTVIASWPASRAIHWNTLLRARAIENQAIVIGVNRSGRDPRLAYAGGSVIFGPLGEEILLAPEHEGIFAADIDPTSVDAARKAFRFMPDRKSRL